MKLMGNNHYPLLIPRSPKKQVAESDLLWQQPPTCWSMEMWYPTRSFWGDATVSADYPIIMTMTYSSPDYILEVKSQRSRSHLDSYVWWQNHLCQCQVVEVHPL